VAGTRPRIQWRVLDGTDDTAAWTPGWLPESDTLRWSLAMALTVEGAVATRSAAYAAADGARFEEGWVAEDDFGDVVRVDAECRANDGTWLPNARAATFAYFEVDHSD